MLNAQSGLSGDESGRCSLPGLSQSSSPHFEQLLLPIYRFPKSKVLSFSTRYSVIFDSIMDLNPPDPDPPLQFQLPFRPLRATPPKIQESRQKRPSSQTEESPNKRLRDSTSTLQATSQQPVTSPQNPSPLTLVTSSTQPANSDPTPGFLTGEAIQFTAPPYLLRTDSTGKIWTCCACRTINPQSSQICTPQISQQYLDFHVDGTKCTHNWVYYRIDNGQGCERQDGTEGRGVRCLKCKVLEVGRGVMWREEVDGFAHDPVPGVFVRHGEAWGRCVHQASFKPDRTLRPVPLSRKRRQLNSRIFEALRLRIETRTQQPSHD